MVKLDFPLKYKITFDEGKMLMRFPDYNFETQTIFFNTDTAVIGKEIENQGVIYIYKRWKSIIITDEQKCDQNDIVCDPFCIIAGVCDSACYNKFVKDTCNFYCVDKTKDIIVSKADKDGICDPDCYGNNLRGGAYDPDCLKTNDKVCDPNTHGIKDDFCDNDCTPTNGVCDPDCKAYDVDCPHQKNGFCEAARGEMCDKESDCACDLATKVCLPSCPGVGGTPEGCVLK